MLREPDDFTSLKVVVLPADHARILPTSLESLAGDRAGQPQWRDGLAAMLDCAERHGWVNERGVSRSHRRAVTNVLDYESGETPVTV